MGLPGADTSGEGSRPPFWPLLAAKEPRHSDGVERLDDAVEYELGRHAPEEELDVAGAAALFLSTHPAATPAQVRTALHDAGTTDWVGDPDTTQEPLLNVANL